MGVDFSLQGRVAIVTGGAGGIGEAYCRTLGEAGASVVVADLNGERANELAARLVEAGMRALAVQVDVADEESAKAMAAAASAEFGGIDILVNNAALMSERPTRGVELKDYPIEWWDRVIKVNLGGTLNCTQACVPSMIERGGGKIVNQSSSAAYQLHSEAYAISKLGVVGLTIALARELGKHNINVNGIAPGLIATDAMRSVGFSFDEAQEEPRVKEGSVAIRAFGQPEDLCGALLLLCSPAGRYMSGQTLRIDGGGDPHL